MVCGPRCEAQAKQDLTTAQLLGNVQVMALGPEPKRDGSLLKTDIADLKRDLVRESRKTVCPGKQVLWINCLDKTKRWFADCFHSSAARKDALQRVIGENMLMQVDQILESKSILDHWEFQVIISSTTKACVPYLSQKELLVVTKSGKGVCAESVVETGSHSGLASHVIEVHVRGKTRYPSDIKNFVEKVIESMQPLALRAREGKKRGPDIVHLMALEGLKV
jgi:hypothetical protein